MVIRWWRVSHSAICVRTVASSKTSGAMPDIGWKGLAGLGII